MQKTKGGGLRIPKALSRQPRLAEVEAIGFMVLSQIPKWFLKQDIIVLMAKRYNLQRDCLVMDVDNIHVNGASIGHAMGLPSRGYEFSSFDKKNPEHEQIKSMFQGKSLKWLKDFVLVYPMTSEEKRRVFRRTFLLMVVKDFLCPTPSASISPEMHLPSILDVENPMKYNWSLQSFHWLRDGINEYQNKGKKHIGGCTFALLVC
ncbi:hypothetical protein PIB30_070850 [Stylosanthes scabra]|uniref:Uncharacterized protein n=1 Tax=Stylosanthes scabra TaxID=79078 RepID=A0ABU6SNP2_9FABA|nr:hypothetical protein [Stylosanthes scabra]